MTYFQNKTRFGKDYPIRQSAFTLVEAIVTLTIAAMVMIATLNIYSRVKAAAGSINRKLDENVLATEILQRIAEDIDSLALPGMDTRITIQSKPDNGYTATKMTIENTIYNKNNRPTTFEKVIWQTNFDPFTGTLMLYRSHSGINLDDPLFAPDPAQEQIGDLFVPLADGITYFTIEVPKGDTTIKQWASVKLPNAVRVTISTAPFVEMFDGSYEVPENDRLTRTIAVDRTRPIKFVFIQKEFDPNDLIDETEEEQEIEDPNQIIDDVFMTE